MRRSDDLPRRRVPRVSGRAVVITLVLGAFFVAVFGRAISRFYIDALWYQALGRGDVFWGQIGAKSLMFLVFFAVFAAIAGVNLYVADRVAPDAFPANVHPYVERFHEVFGSRLRLVRYATAAVLALILALPAVSKWQEWLLFRNSKSFGFTDPQFGVDVGFYVFQLPFLTFAVDWLFAAIVIVIILTSAAHLLNGGVLFTSATPTVRPATRIHLAVLLAVLAAVKAADYWLTRYELTSERRGFVQGATYTVVNAQLPALMLLVLIALSTAVLFLSTIRTNRWRFPVVASALWLVLMLVGALVYPSVVESLVVRPNQEEREAPYIERNVEATRVAMGIDQVATQNVSFDRLTAADVEGDLGPLRNVRLLNPSQMLSKFSFDRGEVAGLQIVDLDVDRYTIDGETRQVLVAARELDLDSIPNKSWQGRHLVSTRGCGLVMAPVGQVATNDRPVYQEVELERPELYFGDAIGSYAIVGTAATESACGGAADEYAGSAGVELGGIFRRAAFALAFFDYNIVGSGVPDRDSQVLWVRTVSDRAAKLAPFLSYDTDPYPVVVDGGVQWVLDAYTSTTAFPYAQRIGDVQLSAATGLSRDANYIRNSVKVVVDAYTGEVTFYVIDDDDPILRAWRGAFPDLFTPITEMPDELREHLRYPEDLFRVQTEMYSKYQLAASDFFRRAGAWSVAQAPAVDRRDTPAPVTTTTDDESADASAQAFATESGVGRFVPYYTMFRNRTSGNDEFVLLRPFVPFSTDDRRTELQALMTASSDPATYGQLTSYVVDQPTLPAGPLRVADRAESDSSIGPELGRLVSDESGQQIRFGDMQIVLVADGLVYVRPVYVTIGDVTEYRYVIVSYNEAAVMDTSLEAGLARLFPGFSGEVGDRLVGDGGDPVPELPSRPETPEDPIDGDLAELLIQAEAAFSDAEAHLADGDLGAYQDAIRRAQRLIQQATAQLPDNP
ncbi:MAG TPA: UPF0182 family protein [Ilumatobacter sp.]|nr:UPF0182 family protein [Ilumatobacter sp.]